MAPGLGGSVFVVASPSMGKDDRVVVMNPAASQATHDRDLVIRTVRDELMQFMGRKFKRERGRELKALNADVLCMVEALAEGMAVLHVDVVRSLANGDTGGYARKLELAREAEQNAKAVDPTK
jgi:hypothetical protein